MSVPGPPSSCVKQISTLAPTTSDTHSSLTTNYAIIGHVAQQLFPDILQELISIKEPTHQLYGDVRANSYLSKNLRANEWTMINNVRKCGYKDFDIPLIYKLTRNLNLVPSPTQGWDYPTPPTSVEILPGDDIERIRRKRNEILHRGNANVQDNELADYFQSFKDVGGRLEVYLGKPKGEFVTRFEVLESCWVDEETEAKYLEQLSLLIEKEKKFEKVLDELRDDVDKMLYKDMHKLEIEEWEEDSKMFIRTEAVDFVIDCLKEGSCCTVIGSSGVGKSATIHHIALYLRDTQGYRIIPCHGPSDIEKYFIKERKQVFVIDDICGRYTALQTEVEEWLKRFKSIDRVMKRGDVKLVSSCRLQVFNDKQFQRLNLFTEKSCDLSSKKFFLSKEQKVQIALQYLSEDIVKSIENTLDEFEFLPLMFALFKARREKNKTIDAVTFFKNPFDKYTEEINELKDLEDKKKILCFIPVDNKQWGY